LGLIENKWEGIPGSLEVLPEETVQRLKNEAMVWPDPQNIQPGKNK